MKGKYRTVYKASYGTVTAVFVEEMTFEEAEALGKEYCEENGYEYVSTEESI